MRPILFVILAGILLGGNLLALVPQDTPHAPTYCATNHKDPAHRCDCVQNDPSGCRDGKRDIEMRSCKAYCAKEMCSCCAS